MTIGLREQKKLATRDAIVSSSFRLFVERGFENVTIAEVAELAGVSEKTVFNYFPTKEDLFFDQADEREAALLESVRGRAPGEPMITAIRRTADAFCEHLGHEGFAQWAGVIDNAPALQDREREMFARFASTVAEELMREGNSEAEARVGAAAVASAYQCIFGMARRRALAGEIGPRAVKRLKVDADQAFALIERGLAQFAIKLGG